MGSHLVVSNRAVLLFVTKQSFHYTRIFYLFIFSIVYL